MFYSVLAQQGADESGIGIVGSLIYLAFVVLLIAAMWRIFVKAGQPGWGALIPIYNAFLLLRIVGRPWYWLLLYMIPIVNVILLILTMNDLAKAFGHGVGFTLGLIFLSPIFFMILGFGGSTYRRSAAPSAA